MGRGARRAISLGQGAQRAAAHSTHDCSASSKAQSAAQQAAQQATQHGARGQRRVFTAAAPPSLSMAEEGLARARRWLSVARLLEFLPAFPAVVAARHHHHLLATISTLPSVTLTRHHLPQTSSHLLASRLLLHWHHSIRHFGHFTKSPIPIRLHPFDPPQTHTCSPSDSLPTLPVDIATRFYQSRTASPRHASFGPVRFPSKSTRPPVRSSLSTASSFASVLATTLLIHHECPGRSIFRSLHCTHPPRARGAVRHPESRRDCSVPSRCARSKVPEVKDEAGKPRIGGLSDPRLGTLDRNYKCQTCGDGSSRNVLATLVTSTSQSPYFTSATLGKVKKILECVCFHCGKLKADVVRLSAHPPPPFLSLRSHLLTAASCLQLSRPHQLTDPVFDQIVKATRGSRKRRFQRVWEYCSKKMVCEADDPKDEERDGLRGAGKAWSRRMWACSAKYPSRGPQSSSPSGRRARARTKMAKSRPSHSLKSAPCPPPRHIPSSRRCPPKTSPSSVCPRKHARPDWMILTVMPVPSTTREAFRAGRR
ncbi:hypothetical protein L1887_60033 [Cichorium endivia]|nr:hypothetical protein L1887_60033 [Cichorium endivia]